MQIELYIYLYNNCVKEAGTPQQLNTNYSDSVPFTKYQYKYKLYKTKIRLFN
jgi:hypothetical protein